MKLNDHEFSRYIDFVKKSSEFPIGMSKVKCAVGCAYCCENFLPDHLKDEDFKKRIDKEEFKRILSQLKKESFTPRRYVYFGSRWCDIFMNTDSLDCMEILRKTYTKPIFLMVSTCVMLNEGNVDRLIKFLNENENIWFLFSVLLPLKDEREEFFEIPNTDLIYYLLKNIDHRKNKVDIYDCTYSTPDNFAKGVEMLVNKYKVRKVTAKAMFYLRYHNERMKEISLNSVSIYKDSLKAIEKYKDKVIINPTPGSYEDFFNIGFKNETVDARVSLLNRKTSYYKNLASVKFKNKKILFCSPEILYEYWVKKFEKISNVKVVLIKNYTFGGNIWASGLLMFDDIIKNIKDLDLDYDLMFLPQEMVNYHRTQKDYYGNDVSILKKELNKEFSVMFL